MTAPTTTPAVSIPTLRDALRNAGRLLRLLRPYWSRIAAGFGMSLVIGLLALVTPLLSKRFFDEVYPARDFEFLDVLVIAVFVVSTTSALMTAYRGYYGQRLGARLTTETGLIFFNHLQHLETRFFDSRRVGEIVSRSADLQRSISFLTGALQTVLINGVYLLFVPPLLFLLNWQLALLALLTTPVTAAISFGTGGPLRRLAKRTMELNAEASGYSVEVLTNIRVVKAAAAEPDTFAQMRNRVVEAQEAQLKSGALTALIGLAKTVVRAAGMAAFSWFAWRLILEQRLTLGSFIAFSAYLGYLTGPVGQFAGLFTTFQETAVSLGRFFEYYDLPVEQNPSISVAPRRAIRRRVRGAIEFDRVTFGYDPARPVLVDISLRLGPGGVTALVGGSGAGKSSLVKLLLRMYSPQRGTISVDGTPIERFELAELRGQIGAVWQDNGALRGSLRDNLVLGGGDVAEEHIAEAVRLARLDELVASLPDGLDTMVSEWGGTLSGGQRQRLAIARALVRRSPILILDEATSNLDAATEEDLLRGVFQRAHDTTVLFITHRLVSASLADRIFLVHESNVMGGLPHSDMLVTHPVYRDLWSAATGRPPDLPGQIYAARTAGNALKRL